MSKFAFEYEDVETVDTLGVILVYILLKEINND